MKDKQAFQTVVASSAVVTVAGMAMMYHGMKKHDEKTSATQGSGIGFLIGGMLTFGIGVIGLVVSVPMLKETK